MVRITPSRLASLNTLVTMGVRPGGSSSMVLTSRSAKSVIASVRGMGVALIIRRCGSSACCSSLSRSASRCATPKRCCSSMIASPSLRELHLALDHGMRAHHQPRLTRGHLRQHLAALLALAAAGEPRGRDAQRLQPLHQLAKVLLGQDLGGRHQRALPALVHRDGGGERGHHRLARADVALQQAVHRDLALQVERDLFDHAALRGGQTEGQGGQQLLLQATRLHAEARCALQRALVLGLQLRELLRQQLFELEPLPRGVGLVFQLGQAHVGRGVVQEAQRFAQAQRALGHAAPAGSAPTGRRAAGPRRPPCAGRPAAAWRCSGRPVSAQSRAVCPRPRS